MSSQKRGSQTSDSPSTERQSTQAGERASFSSPEHQPLDLPRLPSEKGFTELKKTMRKVSTLSEQAAKSAHCIKQVLQSPTTAPEREGVVEELNKLLNDTSMFLRESNLLVARLQQDAAMLLSAMIKVAEVVTHTRRMHTLLGHETRYCEACSVDPESLH